MDIKSALKKTGKAINPTCVYCAIVDATDRLSWFHRETYNLIGVVSFSLITKNDWQPYHPTPTKCPACIEADDDNPNGRVSMQMKKHLETYHCTCKGD